MEKRTTILPMHPKAYGILCDKCRGNNIDWSEYQDHIWCYDCLIDTKGTKNLYSGPIPIKVAAILGLYFEEVEYNE